MKAQLNDIAILALMSKDELIEAIEQLELELELETECRNDINIAVNVFTDEKGDRFYNLSTNNVDVEDVQQTIFSLAHIIAEDLGATDIRDALLELTVIHHPDEEDYRKKGVQND